MSIRMKNYKNKRVISFCLKFNFISKNSNLCQLNITKFKVSLKSLNKKNSNLIKRFNFIKKISNSCK